MQEHHSTNVVTSKDKILLSINQSHCCWQNPLALPALKTQKANQTEISTLLSSAPTSPLPAKFLGFTPEPVAIIFHFPPSGWLWKEDVMCLLFPFRHFGWIPSSELTNNIPNSNSRIPRLFLAAGWSHQADFLSTTAPSCFLYQPHILKSNNLKRSITAVFLFCLFYSVVA